MSFEKIAGNIKEYCIACLNKSSNMHNLLENVDKIVIFKTVFNCEFEAIYPEYPHFLCSLCDIKLNITYKFQQDVTRNLSILQDYNNQLDMNAQKGKQKMVYHEIEKTVNTNIKSSYDNVDNYLRENERKDKKENEKYQHKKIHSKNKLVPLEEIKRIVGDFENKFSEKKVCVLCGFFSTNRRAITSHVTSFHKDKKHKYCLECNNFFDSYNDHKQIHSKEYVCPYCNKKISPGGFVEHLQGHSGIFQCKMCQKVFPTSAWLKKHSFVHSKNKPNCSKGFITQSALKYHPNIHGQYACDTCKKHFSTKIELNSHVCSGKLFLNEVCIQKCDEGSTKITEVKENISTKTNENLRALEQKNFCQLCNKRVKSLTQHTKKWHIVLQGTLNIKEEFRCDTCQKTYSSLNRLRLHMRLHSDEQPYKCKFCDKRTVNRSHLIDHERTHTREKPYICSVCGKALSQAAALRTHMKQHTGRPEVCELCSKRFCRKSELKLHMMKHLGEKPFLCTICGKTYAQRSHLTEHMTAHSDERPFQCHYCNKAFKKKVLLKEHIKLHEDQKRFKCTHCSYACHKAYRLRQHMKQHISYNTTNNQNQVIDD